MSDSIDGPTYTSERMEIQQVEWIEVRGNTYPVREQLKALGARWDATARVWRVPAEKAAEAQALVPREAVKQCWECGRSVTRAQVRANGGDWYEEVGEGTCYCGC